MTALAHLSDRAVLRVSGADARDFLQGQLTNDVTRLAEGAPMYAGHLTAQGKTVAAMLLFADGEDVLLDVAATQAAMLAKRLGMYRLRRAVTIAEAPGLAVWARWPGGEQPDPRDARLGDRWIAPVGAFEATATLADYHAHRVALGVPEGEELVDLLWLETNADALNGVSYTKGCYVGQENTARMHHRDKVRRGMVAIRTEAEAPVGAVVMAGTAHGPREAGAVRGEACGGVRMAWLRLEHVGEPLAVDGMAADVVRAPAG